MPDEEDDLYERSPPHAMPHACPQGAGTALMSRETCRLAGHRVTSASGRSPRRMWSRWARLGHIPSGRPIVLRTYTLCHTPQCTAHRRAAVARSSAHPATLAHAGEEAQPRGVPGEVSQLARSVAQRVAAPSERLSGPEPSAHTGTGGQGWAMRQAASLSRCACRFSRPDITTNSTRTFGKHPSRSTRSSVRRPLDPCSRPYQPNLAPA